MAEDLHRGSLGTLKICLFDRNGTASREAVRLVEGYDGLGHITLATSSTNKELEILLETQTFDLLAVVCEPLGETGLVLVPQSDDGRAESGSYTIVLLALKSPRGGTLSRNGTFQRDMHYQLSFPLPQKQFSLAMDEIASDFERAKSGPLLVSSRNGMRAVYPRQIVYVESNRRVLFIHLENEVLRVYKKLADLLEELPRNFVHCHKSFLLNMDYVEKLGIDHAHMNTGDDVPVSQKRRQAMRAAFEAYIGRTL